MLQTVKCFNSVFLWEEEVTYDDNYWEYIEKKRTAYVCYRNNGNFKVPEKPKGMTHCYRTFESYEGDKLDLSSFDTSDVTDMCRMFCKCQNLQSLDLFSFDTSKVTSMESMFRECENLQFLDVSSFDTSKVTHMGSMFYGCTSLQSLDVSSFDTFKVINMHWMFGQCEKLCSLDLSSFDTSNVTDMYEMFYKCENLQFLDVSSFDTSNVTSMSDMFGCCSSLKSLDLSSFNTSNVKYMEGIFENTNLTKESTGLGLFNKKSKTPNVRNKDSIFDEIDELFHNGNVSSPTSLVKDLKNKGYSDLEIVNAIYSKIESGNLDRGMYMPVVTSYESKVIIPVITKYFSDRSVGEVLGILYKKYPRVIVNEAMCSYLSPHYLVD